MSVRIRDAGNAQRLVKGFKIRDGGGTQRTIKTGKIRDGGGTLRTFYLSSTMLVTPLVGTVTANGWTAGPSKTVSTGPQGFTVVGGTPPFTYLWSRTSASAGFTISATNINAPTWSKLLGPDDFEQETWKCVVTDAAGATLTVTRNIVLQLVLIETEAPG